MVEEREDSRVMIQWRDGLVNNGESCRQQLGASHSWCHVVMVLWHLAIPGLRGPLEDRLCHGKNSLPEPEDPSDDINDALRVVLYPNKGERHVDFGDCLVETAGKLMEREDGRRGFRNAKPGMSLPPLEHPWWSFHG